MASFNKHIIIVGSARSGTSWLCELFAKPYRYRLLFEPEHEFQTKNGYLLCDRWMQNKQEALKAHQYLKKVFLNRVDNNWIAQHSNRKWKRHLWPFIPKKFIIKFVRCNMAANYMNKSFGIPVIHLIRNPFDVIESQQRVKFPWLYDLEKFQKQKKLVAYIKANYQYDISDISHRTDIEKLALRWCLENKVILDFNKDISKSYKIVNFEDLRNNKNLFIKLCEEFNFQPYTNIDGIYNNPSSKSHPRGLKGESDKKTQFLKKSDEQSIQEILNIFKVKL